MSFFSQQIKLIDNIVSKLDEDQRKRMITYINLTYRASQINERLGKLIGENKSDSSDSDDSDAMSDIVTEVKEEVKVPKKRGRKPKPKA